VPLAVGEPEHQVGERQVGDDLPVRDEQVEPRDVLVGEVGVGPGQLGQRRHRASVDATVVATAGAAG